METLEDEHLMRCNSMRHLETIEERQAFVAQCVLQGLDMRCPGPIPGQMHLICRLPEETKQITESLVRPIMRDRDMASRAQQEVIAG